MCIYKDVLIHFCLQMYVYVSIRINKHTCIFIIYIYNICMYKDVCQHTFVCMNQYTHTHTCVYVYQYTHVSICINKYTHANMYQCKYIHVYIRAHMYQYTHANMCVYMCWQRVHDSKRQEARDACLYVYVCV